MLSTRDPPQNKGHIQTESEGLEKDISCKWRPKESQLSYFKHQASAKCVEYGSENAYN